MRELLERIDSRELSEWFAYYQLNPWGPERADLRSGVIAATVANSMGGGGFKPSDFMPEYGPAEVEEPKSWEDIRDAAIRMTGMMGGVMIGV